MEIDGMQSGGFPPTPEKDIGHQRVTSNHRSHLFTYISTPHAERYNCAYAALELVFFAFRYAVNVVCDGYVSRGGHAPSLCRSN
ncbi:hypothetical protein EVAR_19739_1 [Eumeta japonica]|uniref:Uncharacterized protein n=1 Tax=Eumeta variegata TaxID=151549 RepID=A0A4C1UQH9_EUMVA|nr:hypothetical protein EVAR_19739_1 [Eumeta japonica]